MQAAAAVPAVLGLLGHCWVRCWARGAYLTLGAAGAATGRRCRRLRRRCVLPEVDSDVL